MSKLRIISLFSGCGGLDLGFHRHGFVSAVCIENNPIMAETLRLNRISKNIVPDDIQNVSNEQIASITGLTQETTDLVLGGPPCPAFSKSRFYRKELAHGTDDETWQTVEEYFRVVEGFKPRAFVLENVHTFAAKRQKGALDYVIRTGSALGYKVYHKVLNAVDYGVPQKRERLFIVGTRSLAPFDYPAPSHRKMGQVDTVANELPPWKTAGDAIADLDIEMNDHSLEGHFAGGKDHALLRSIPPGDNYLFFTKERGHKKPLFRWRSRYWSFLLKLSPDLPSWTIQARRSNNMGPFHWRSRILTIPEIKRIQTFPDDYLLGGNVENQWRQVGNAVPPLLAEAVAQSVYAHLKKRNPKRGDYRSKGRQVKTKSVNRRVS
jgi:DNA (cytosine-5)-methyltransferase 1